ncbi:uncharacterized protein RHIMIDRAFT_242816 [Rhizopus microsporus ATCC 52813]|uniref:Protein kinase domain-containing protein n=1 Tax=Rhizopus microsporus ATCC 52813 TaxID=1340429 RepID=A0A2G4SEU2_RHIZD|nr:uncharacterized protein RHIMIDRAFT_242816 [Rhizopus microsporus ATCC 52813]PHZ07302.1 hypothetical protein RHIMIDRAFT_242816 [Rhizopus microsporus ATCC 52813]
MTIPSNIILDISTLNKNNPREFHCKGTYQGVPIECIYIPVCNEDRSQYYHEFYMSDRLTACRNMGVYFNMFEATLSEMNINYKEVPSERSGLFLIRQHYPNGCLRDYVLKNRVNGIDTESMHAIQAGINLFSMLADAHALNMFLVGIDTKNIFVDIDGSLRFFGFRYSFQKGKSAEKALWSNWSDIRCPENAYLNQSPIQRKPTYF